jgi:hypothetical protein
MPWKWRRLGEPREPVVFAELFCSGQIVVKPPIEKLDDDKARWAEKAIAELLGEWNEYERERKMIAAEDEAERPIKERVRHAEAEERKCLERGAARRAAKVEAVETDRRRDGHPVVLAPLPKRITEMTPDELREFSRKVADGMRLGYARWREQHGTDDW